VNSLTLVREYNAGSARLSAAYRTDQSDRADVFWHYHAFDHDTLPLQADVQFRSIGKDYPELSAECRPTQGARYNRSAPTSIFATRIAAAHGRRLTAVGSAKLIWLSHRFIRKLDYFISLGTNCG
jgi:hypothetical protein